MPKSLKARYAHWKNAAEKGIARTVAENRPKVRRLRKRVLRAEQQAEKAITKRWEAARPVLRHRWARLRKGAKVAMS